MPKCIVSCLRGRGEPISYHHLRVAFGTCVVLDVTDTYCTWLTCALLSWLSASCSSLFAHTNQKRFFEKEVIAAGILADPAGSALNERAPDSAAMQALDIEFDQIEKELLEINGNQQELQGQEVSRGCTSCTESLP